MEHNGHLQAFSLIAKVKPNTAVQLELRMILMSHYSARNTFHFELLFVAWELIACDAVLGTWNVRGRNHSLKETRCLRRMPRLVVAQGNVERREPILLTRATR